MKLQVTFKADGISTILFLRYLGVRAGFHEPSRSRGASRVYP